MADLPAWRHKVGDEANSTSAGAGKRISRIITLNNAGFCRVTVSTGFLAVTPIARMPQHGPYDLEELSILHKD